MNQPKTLTEAQLQGGIIGVRLTGEGKSLSTFRTIPYAELYRESSAADRETPVQYLQQAAKDEARRKSSRRR